MFILGSSFGFYYWGKKGSTFIRHITDHVHTHTHTQINDWRMELYISKCTFYMSLCCFSCIRCFAFDVV